MSQFPTGSYIRKGDERRKILGEAGEVRFVSQKEGSDELWKEEYVCGYSGTVQELIRYGWAEEKPEWKPEKLERGMTYFYVNDTGGVCWYRCYRPTALEDANFKARLSIGNCFPTREACEAYVNKLKEQAKK